MSMKKTIAAMCAVLAASLAGSKAELVPVTTDIASGTTVTWSATNQYRLDTVIYVQTNATLVIEPGTVVYGATNVTVARNDIPELVSALWVTRGGKLMAEGTREKPIIFTAEGDRLDGSIPPTQTSLWGGVVVMGNAVINSAKDAVGNVASPKFDVYEGVTGPGSNFEHRFGGSNDDDSSGVLRYVSIRHAGRIFAPDAELNALTLAGVGRGTVVEYVEVYAGSDDGFEWWGGTVGSRYLVSGFIEDDDFDTDQGYRGTNQFWFGIKPPWAGTADSRGIESDGDLNQSALGEMPFNRWSAYNVTLIGRGKSETAGGLGVAWNTRDEDAPMVFNSVFTDWNQGLRLDLDGLYHHTNATRLASIRNNLWNVTDAATDAGDFLFTGAEFMNQVGDAMLGGVSYMADGVLDPRPKSGSPVYQNVMAGAPAAVGYRGAFAGPEDDWADGWTALSRYGYLKAATPRIDAMVSIEGGMVVVRFESVAGRAYRVQSRRDLFDGAWGDVGGVLTGNGAVLMHSEPVQDVPSMFFRVVAP